jgi:dihydrofolate synthase/folylpolyglutamate synthase
VPEAAAVFESVSAARHAPLLLGGRDWSTDEVRATRRGTGFALQINPSALAHLGGVPAGGWDTDLHGVLRFEGLFTPLLGAHQAVNAGAAAVAALVAAAHLPRIGVEAIRRGLASVHWAGRLQMIDGSPPLVVDGAHTAESAEILAQAMRSLFPGERIVLICGAQGDKDIPAIAAPLARLAAVAVATQAQHPRAAPAPVVAEALRAAGCPDVREAPTVEEALALARSLSGSGDLILGTGSLYVVGELLAVAGR